jgi:hypothetical protein
MSNMGKMSQVECVKYSLHILRIVLIVGVISGGIMGIGFFIAGGGAGIFNLLVGGLLFGAGALVGLSGMLGILHKVIVDGIIVANEHSINQG